MVEYNATNIEKLSFEEAMSELEKIVKQLEEGKVQLDDAIKAYEYGNLLKKYCEQKLQDVKTRVEKINITNNQLTTESFEDK